VGSDGKFFGVRRQSPYPAKHGLLPGLTSASCSLYANIGQHPLTQWLSRGYLCMQALEKENSKIELETAVLDNWKTEHHDDFVSVFGSADSSGESGEPIWLLLRA
jgi:hypothetical protein